MMEMNICLLYGGKSPEHEVSLLTAKAVISAINFEKYSVYPVYITKEGYWIKGDKLTGPVEDVTDLQFEGENLDVLNPVKNVFSGQTFDIVFPLLHGPNGEDGTVQGLLEVLNLPYVGNGVLSSSAGMDKVIMKNIFAHAGLEQVNYVWFLRSTWRVDPEAVYKKVEAEIGYPCFVKPANLGSSVGINKCDNREELVKGITEAFKYDRKIIVEEGVQAREIEIALLGNDEPECSICGEIVPKKEFYDYEAKYIEGDTELIIPAEITSSEYEEIKKMAIRAFKALDCSGLVRADFFLKEDGTILINEVNTMPGFTPVSMYPLLWKHTGVDYPDLIERLLQLGLERHEEKQSITYTVKTKTLSQ